MSRRKKENYARDIGVDPKFGSPLVQKLINVIMERGKKDCSRRIVYEAFEVILKKVNGDQAKAIALFNKALDQVMPFVEVRTRRVGGSVYQIPKEVESRRRLSLGLRWLIKGAQERTNKTMGQRLASELLDAVEGRGGAVKKRIDVQKMAEANRAFSHYAW